MSNTLNKGWGPSGAGLSATAQDQHPGQNSWLPSSLFSSNIPSLSLAILLEEAPYLQGQEGGLNQERVPIAFVNNWIIHEHMLQF